MSGIWNILSSLFFSLVFFIGLNFLFSSMEIETVGNLIILTIIILYFLLVFRDAKKRERKAFQKLEDTLMSSEEIINKGMDKRPFALFSRRKILGVTSSRFICLYRGILGGYQMKDYQWKDLVDIRISENVLPRICGSTLTFLINNKEQNYNVPIVTTIDSKIGSSIYQFGQMQEQAWEEKRRIREMEEKRAQSGGTYITSGSNDLTPSNNAISNTGNQSATNKLVAEIQELKNLVDQGILSDAEFQEAKSKILSRFSNDKF